MDFLKNKVLLAALLVLVSFAAFFPVTKAGFSNFDDPVYVTENPQIRDFSPAGFGRIFTTTHYGLYKPLVMASFAVEYRLFGLDPRPYHFDNLLLHLLNTVLVFLLVLELGLGTWAAFAVGLLFGVHPMHVESVAWIVERKDMLYCLFFLAALLSYARYLNIKSRQAYIWSVVFFPLSLMAKPMGITLPAVLFLFDYLRGRKIDWPAVREKIPHLLVACIFTAVTLVALHGQKQMVEETSVVSLLDRALFACYGIVFYIRKFFAPVGLSLLHPFPAKTGAFLPLAFWLSGAGTAALAALLWFLRGNRIFVFGMLLYLITVFPVLQWLPVGPAIAADRYSYFPYVGLSVIAAVFAQKLWERLHNNRARTALALCGVLISSALFAASYRRCGMWSKNSTLWRDVLRQYPYSSVARNNLGTSVIEEEKCTTAGCYKKVWDYMNAAIKNDPGMLAPYLNMAAVSVNMRDYESVERIARAVLAADPANAQAMRDMGLVSLARKKDKKGALVWFEKALRSDPNDESVLLSLAVLQDDIGDRASSIRTYRRLAALNPRDEEALFGLAKLLADTGDNASAIDCYQRLLELNPRHEGALINAANIFSRAGDTETGIKLYRLALEVNPTGKEAAANLAAALKQRAAGKNAK